MKTAPSGAVFRVGPAAIRAGRFPIPHDVGPRREIGDEARVCDHDPVSDRWQRVPFTDLDRQQLPLLTPTLQGDGEEPETLLGGGQGSEPRIVIQAGTFTGESRT